MEHRCESREGICARSLHFTHHVNNYRLRLTYSESDFRTAVSGSQCSLQPGIGLGNRKTTHLHWSESLYHDCSIGSDSGLNRLLRSSVDINIYGITRS